MKRSLLCLSAVVLFSTLASAQWTRRVSGMTSQLVGALYADSLTLYAGSLQNVFKSTNLATNWSASGNGLPSAPNFQAIARSGNYLIGGGDSPGIWRSSDDGANWVQTTSGVDSNEYTTRLYVDGNTVYATFGFTASFGISTDNGATWTKHTAGLSPNSTFTGVTKVGSTLFLSHQNAGVYSSADNGVSWTLTAPIGAQNINALTSIGNSIIAGVSGPAGQPGIWLSTDLGVSWTRVLSGPVITGVEVNESIVYAVGDSLRASTDQGATWTMVDGTGLYPVSVWNTIQFAGGFAFVNTFGLGVYRRPISELTTVKELPSAGLPVEHTLSPNYPNPFNPETRFSFSLPQSSNVEITVYDVLGREVRTLVSEKMNAGIYETSFDARGLASGVYFYRLLANDFQMTRRMVLAR